MENTGPFPLQDQSCSETVVLKIKLIYIFVVQVREKKYKFVIKYVRPSFHHPSHPHHRPCSPPMHSVSGSLAFNFSLHDWTKMNVFKGFCKRGFEVDERYILIKLLRHSVARSDSGKLLPPAHEVRGKVLFSQVSVC